MPSALPLHPLLFGVSAASAPAGGGFTVPSEGSVVTVLPVPVQEAPSPRRAALLQGCPGHAEQAGREPGQPEPLRESQQLPAGEPGAQQPPQVHHRQGEAGGAGGAGSGFFCSFFWGGIAKTQEASPALAGVHCSCIACVRLGVQCPCHAARRGSRAAPPAHGERVAGCAPSVCPAHCPPPPLSPFCLSSPNPCRRCSSCCATCSWSPAPTCGSSR